MWPEFLKNPQSHLIGGIFTLTGVVLGVFLNVWAEWLKRRLWSGKLEAFFGENPDEYDYVASTIQGKTWVRMLVVNKRRGFVARECRAYLTNLSYPLFDGPTYKSPVSDSLPLVWANTDGKDVIDIAYGVNQFLDLFVISSCEPNIIHLQTNPKKHRSIEWRDGNKIDFEVTIVSERGLPINKRASISKNDDLKGGRKIKIGWGDKRT